MLLGHFISSLPCSYCWESTPGSMLGFGHQCACAGAELFSVSAPGDLHGHTTVVEEQQGMGAWDHVFVLACAAWRGRVCGARLPGDAAVLCTLASA